MRTTVAALAGLMLFVGCAGGRSARIREVQADSVAECKYLGVVEASDRSGWTMSDDQLGAMAAIRRMVSEKGGNAFVLTQGAVSSYAPSLRADVYRCP